MRAKVVRERGREEENGAGPAGWGVLFCVLWWEH